MWLFRKNYVKPLFKFQFSNEITLKLLKFLKPKLERLICKRSAAGRNAKPATRADRGGGYRDAREIKKRDRGCGNFPGAEGGIVRLSR
jgi:hypothetical protein